MNLKILCLFDKVLDIFKKRSKNGEKSQEIQDKKLNYFNKYLAISFLIILSVCILSSLFPNLFNDVNIYYELLE
ncbi:MAG: hypothetical protein ACPGDB_05190, partial [Fusobacterium sp.]